MWVCTGNDVIETQLKNYITLSYNFQDHIKGDHKQNEVHPQNQSDAITQIWTNKQRHNAKTVLHCPSSQFSYQ